MSLLKCFDSKWVSVSLLCVASTALVHCGGREFGDGNGSGGDTSLGGGDSSGSGGAPGGAGGSNSGGAPSGGDTSMGGDAGGDSGSGGDGSGGATATPVYVKCGAATECPVHDGGQCCHTVETNSYVCQAQGASCSTSGGVTGPVTARRYSYACDGPADCPSGQLCCFSRYPSSVPSGSAVCADSCPAVSGQVTNFTLCDPDHVAPSDCSSGACGLHTSAPSGERPPVSELSFCR